MSEFDAEIIISSGITASASKTAIDIEQIITQMRASGMTANEIRDVLLSDLNEGGRIFGTYRNSIKATVSNGVEHSANRAYMKFYTEAGKEDFRWVAISDSNLCPDCAGRDGDVQTIKYWRAAGMPKSGFSVCQDACRCVLQAE
jgi:hypothetical protein